MWFYVCSDPVVDGCRLHDTLADGINICVDMRNIIVKLHNSGTGNDRFAMWPRHRIKVFFSKRLPRIQCLPPLHRQLPFLANGSAIYGGAKNRIEDCLFPDISPGCGVLLGPTFRRRTRPEN